MSINDLTTLPGMVQ